jgi:hypothetical protein
MFQKFRETEDTLPRPVHRWCIIEFDIWFHHKNTHATYGVYEEDFVFKNEWVRYETSLKRR